MIKTAIALGSNMGDRLGNLRKAVNMLKLRGIVFVRKSDVFETEPVGPKNQPYFLNACAIVETDLQPLEFLDLIKQAEIEIGRKKRQKWGPREIDIDILLMEDQNIRTPRLTIPHPLLHERSFVLFPLIQVAPDWIHPVCHMTIQELWEKLEDKDSSILRISAL